MSETNEDGKIVKSKPDSGGPSRDSRLAYRASDRLVVVAEDDEGLNRVICKRLERHGLATVGVHFAPRASESDPTLDSRLAPLASNGSPLASRLAPLASNPCVVVAEDDEGLNRVICKRLERHGIKTIGVHTGADAIAAAQQHPECLLLVDYVLGDMDARQLLASLDNMGLRVPFMVMTGQGDERIAVEMMKLGARDYLVKQPDFVDLVPPVVERVLGQLETERKLGRAELGLRESEEAYRTLAKNLPGLVYRCDLKQGGTMQFMNDLLVPMTGYRADELHAGTICSIEPLIIEPDRPGVVAEVERAIVEDRPFAVEYRLRRKDGSERFFIERGRPVRGDDGLPSHIDGVIFDVTESRQAERALRTTVERFHLMLSHMPLGVLLVDARDCVEFVNQLFCDMFGLTGGPASLVGLTSAAALAKLLPAYADPTGTLARIRSVLAAGASDIGDEVAMRDGRVITVDFLPVVAGGKEAGRLWVHRDTTERKQAELALRESDEKYKLVVENAGQAILVVQDGKLVFTNPHASEIVGFPREELLGRPFIEFIHADDRALVADNYRKRLAGEHLPDRYEFRVVHRNGATRQVEINAVRLDWKGRPATLNFLADVTGRRQAEAETTQRAAAEQALLGASLAISRCRTDDEVCEAAADLVFKLNPDSRVLVTLFDPALNGIRVRSHRGFGSLIDSALAVIGQDPRRTAIPVTEMTDAEVALYNSGRVEELPDGVYALMARRVPRAACAAVERLLGIDRVYCVGFGFEGAHNGGIVLLAGKGAAVRSREMIETLVNHVAVAVRRLRAEQSMWKEKERAQEYLDIAGVMLIALDENGRITLVNRHGSGALGYGEGELVGKSWFDTCVPERLRSEVKGVFGWLMVGAVKPVEYYESLVVTRSGEERLIAWHNVVLRDKSGRAVGTLSSGADISERKQAEAELVKHRDHLEELVCARTRELTAAQGQLVLQEKLATVGRVAGSVAHELRNPLGAILNASFYLQMTAAPKLEGKELRHLQVIDEYVDRANQAISMILDFTQGRQPEPAPCALQPILQRAVADASLPPNVEVLIAIPPRLPQVMVDDGQIVVVFRNLLTNAGRAMPGGGTVKIQARAGQNEVVVDMADTGSGVKPEHMARLFQPLFTTGEIGIGLGLSICKGFVRANKGTISVVSELGKGTTFTVILPTTEGNPSA